MPYDEEKQGWYPGKHIKGLLGRVKEHASKFKEGGEYGPRTIEQQMQTAVDRRDAVPTPDLDWGGKQDVASAAGAGYAQKASQSFDPSSNEEVLSMQRALNAAGIKGADGKPLEEDGILGANTERALRYSQGQRDDLSGLHDRAESMRDQGIQDLPEGFQGPAPNTVMPDASMRDAQTLEDNPERSWLDKLKTRVTGHLQQNISPAGPGGRMGAYGGGRSGRDY